MSAGFGVGLTRNFCPEASLEERLETLRTIAQELGLPVIRDFVHPSDTRDWREILERESYGVVELAADELRWLESEQVTQMQQEIGQHWSESGSFNEVMWLADEETSLILPGIDPGRLNSNGKGILQTRLPGYEQTVVYLETEVALRRLGERLENPELCLEEASRSVLLRGQSLMQVCRRHHLPFYLAWA